MPNTDICTYHLVWRTCRNKPIIKGETESLLKRTIEDLCALNDLHLQWFDIKLEGREVNLKVSTNNLAISPMKIANLLRRKTSSILRENDSQIRKLPAVWTGQFLLGTYGRGVRND